MNTLHDPTRQTDQLHPLRGEFRPLDIALDRLVELGVTVRLRVRRARLRRAGLRPGPVRAMSEEERVAALRLLEDK